MLKLEGFEDAVKEAWVCDPNIVDPFKSLDALFRNVAEFLQAWGQKKSGQCETANCDGKYCDPQIRCGARVESSNPGRIMAKVIAKACGAGPRFFGAHDCETKVSGQMAQRRGREH